MTVTPTPLQNPDTTRVLVDPDGSLNQQGANLIQGLVDRTGGPSGVLLMVDDVDCTGTSQGTAAQLTGDVNSINTVTAGVNDGVILIIDQTGCRQEAFNNTGLNVKIYPPVGSQIDALGINAPYILATKKTQIFTVYASGTIRSLQLG